MIIDKEDAFHEKVRLWMHSNGMPPGASLDDLLVDWEQWMTPELKSEADKLMNEFNEL